MPLDLIQQVFYNVAIIMIIITIFFGVRERNRLVRKGKRKKSVFVRLF